MNGWIPKPQGISAPVVAPSAWSVFQPGSVNGKTEASGANTPRRRGPGIRCIH